MFTLGKRKRILLLCCSVPAMSVALGTSVSMTATGPEFSLGLSNASAAEDATAGEVGEISFTESRGDATELDQLRRLAELQRNQISLQRQELGLISGDAALPVKFEPLPVGLEALNEVIEAQQRVIETQNQQLILRAQASEAAILATDASSLVVGPDQAAVAHTDAISDPGQTSQQADRLGEPERNRSQDRREPGSDAVSAAVDFDPKLETAPDASTKLTEPLPQSTEPELAAYEVQSVRATGVAADGPQAASPQAFDDIQQPAGSDRQPPEGVQIASQTADASDIEALREVLREQSELLEQQSRQLEEQRRSVEAQRQRLEQLERQVVAQPAAAPPQVQRAAMFVMPEHLVVPGGESYTLIQDDEPATSIDDPDAGRTDEVSGVYEVGGILTRQGEVILEPSIEYSQSNLNRFFFQGLEIVETVLVGNIEATDSDRDTYVAAATARVGVTDRIEVEVKVPGLYRSDRITRQIIGPDTTIRRSINGKGLGDVEASARMQLNDGLENWPIFVASGRFKSKTGQGPFDVDRDASGIELELPTGSGFYGAEAGLSSIFVSDPVVFFGGVKYFAHLGRDVDKMIGTSVIGHVDPGDVFGLSFGMGFGVNERASFSLSYQHDFVFKTQTEIDGVDVESETLDVGALGVGFSYALSDMTSVNLNLTAGVTEDAPDVRMMLRVPMRFDWFSGG